MLFINLKADTMQKITINLWLSLILFVFIPSCNSNKTDTKDNTQKPTVKNETTYPKKACMLSAYIFKADGRKPPENSGEIIKDFEKLIDHKIASVLWYPTFSDNFPTKQCEKMNELGIIPHLTWELFFPESAEYNTMPIEGTYKLTDEVLAGKHDAYIEQFAADAKAYKHEVLIRFLHEFNGNWYLWSGNKNGRENGGPEKVVAVWKYVVDKFREIEADNVKWIWNPHGPSIDVPDEEWNNIKNYWPGKDYVDWIGMDAYNWYPKDPWGGKRPFRSFDNCFKELYTQCTQLGKHPIMIAEFGSPEFNYKGKTKADWISDAFSKIKNEYPQIKMLAWFHINKELDWRVNSSPESLEAFKKAVASPYFYGRK